MSTTRLSQAHEGAFDSTHAGDATTSVETGVVAVELELDSIDSPGSDELSLPTTAKVFVLTRFWRSIAISRPRPPPSPAHLGHSAQVLFQVLTGGASAAPKAAAGSRSKQRLRKSSTTGTSGTASSHPLNPSTPLLSSAEVSTAHGIRSIDSHPPPKVSRKAVKKLKRDLLRQRNAVRIVEDIRTIEPPEGSSAARAYALPVLPFDDSPVVVAASEPAFTLISVPVSGGGLAGLAGARAGAFDLAAGATGALLKDSTGFFAPLDRIGVYTFWWGYELSLPPQAIAQLSAMHSMSTTLFTFLQAFVLGGGAPELAPFVKYLSSYIDLEWSAIQSQNRGHGVVLAATWLLPVALVPRPWDFPLPRPPNIVLSPPEEDEPSSPVAAESTLVPLPPPV